MKTAGALSLVIVVSLLIMLSFPLATFAKRKKSNDSLSPVCMIAGLTLGGAVYVPGEGGQADLGLGVNGNTQDDSGFHGGVL